MPKQMSVEKRARTNIKRQVKNTYHITRIKTETKKLRDITDPDSAAAHYREVASLLDKAAKRGNLHHKNASRRKSRLAKQVNRLTAK